MTWLHELVPRAAARAAGAPAVRGPDGALAYGELDGCSNRVARELKRLGVGHGDRVALWTEKSCRVVSAMLGALKLGAVYVPIAAGTPTARARTLLSDCDVRAVVTDRTRFESLGADPPAFAAVLIDEWHSVAEQSLEPLPPPRLSGDDLAYILYTSGSTGQPKGVCISHANAMAFVEWAATAAGVEAHDRLGNHASFNFDLSVFDLYAAFCRGASVVIVPEALGASARPLTDFIRSERISVWYSVPSALVLMIEHGQLLEQDLSLATVIFAGEVFPIRHLKRMRDAWPGVRLLNFYGPTETNVCASYEVRSIDPARTTPVPIGRASCGNQLWLGDSRRPPVPGQEGELVVEGPTVMRGYWGREPQRDRPYATGDVCRMEPDRNFVYVGRLDNQVKIRGHRVELGEVETILASCPGVGEVAVVVTGEGVEARLVAFFVADAADAPGLVALKTHCAARLPPFMVISLAWRLEAMPLTPNGKVDRRRLGEWATARVQAGGSAIAS